MSCDRGVAGVLVVLELSYVSLVACDSLELNGWWYVGSGVLCASGASWWFEGGKVEIVLVNVLQSQHSSEGPAKFPCDLLVDP